MAMLKTVECGREKWISDLLVHRHWHNIVCEKRYAWNQPNQLRGDLNTGEAVYGYDYFTNMMLWGLPAAIEGKDVRAPTLPGSLVVRIIKATRGEYPCMHPLEKFRGDDIEYES